MCAGACAVKVCLCECAAVEEGSSSFLGFLLLLYADLFFDVSLMAGLHHQFVAVQTGKPPLSRRCAVPPVCCGTNQKTASLSVERCAADAIWYTSEHP